MPFLANQGYTRVRGIFHKYTSLLKEFNKMNRLLKKIILGAAGVLVVGLIAIQLVPYGRNHTNPPVQSEPNWDSPETRALAERACFECHSNETAWPWYSNIAPVSWLVQHDVDEGREKLNFSEWSTAVKKAKRWPNRSGKVKCRQPCFSSPILKRA